MKVFAFLVSFVLFVGGILMFGYAFAVSPEWHILTFIGGVAVISVSLMIPFHLLERLD